MEIYLAHTEPGKDMVLEVCKSKITQVNDNYFSVHIHSQKIHLTSLPPSSSLLQPSSQCTGYATMCRAGHASLEVWIHRTKSIGLASSNGIITTT